MKLTINEREITLIRMALLKAYEGASDELKRELDQLHGKIAIAERAAQLEVEGSKK